MEMRAAVAALVMGFEFDFADSKEDGGRVVGEMKDVFVAVPGPLWMRFRERKA